jgi:hypothetical protein
LGVSELQESRRSRSRVGLVPVVTVVAVTVVALFLAPFLWAGTTPGVRPAPNPVPRVTTVSGDGQTAAEKAGFTGRLGGGNTATSSATPNAGGPTAIEKLNAGRA